MWSLTLLQSKKNFYQYDILKYCFLFHIIQSPCFLVLATKWCFVEIRRIDIWMASRSLILRWEEKRATTPPPLPPPRLRPEVRRRIPSVCLRNSLSYGQAVSEAAGPPSTEEIMLLFLHIFVYVLVPRRFHYRSRHSHNVLHSWGWAVSCVCVCADDAKIFFAVPYSIGLGWWEF